MSSEDLIISQLNTPDESILDVWYFCWTDKTFILSFIGFSVFPFILIWIFGTKYFGIKDIEFIGYISSSFHALFVVTICFLITINYTESDLFKINISQNIPFLFIIFRFLGIFQTSYFMIDLLQILFFYSDKSISYRIAISIHHIFSLLCSCCIYRIDPFISYIYAINSLIEFSNWFLNIRYFAAKFKYKNLYYFGGIGTLIFYPLTRTLLTGYAAYTAWFGVFHLFVGNSGVILVVATNIFITILSMYYTKVLWTKPANVYILKIKTK